MPPNLTLRIHLYLFMPKLKNSDSKGFKKVCTLLNLHKKILLQPGHLANGLIYLFIQNKLHLILLVSMGYMY